MPSRRIDTRDSLARAWQAAVRCATQPLSEPAGRIAYAAVLTVLVFLQIPGYKPQNAWAQLGLDLLLTFFVVIGVTEAFLNRVVNPALSRSALHLSALARRAASTHDSLTPIVKPIAHRCALVVEAMGAPPLANVQYQFTCTGLSRIGDQGPPDESLMILEIARAIKGECPD